MLVQQRAIINSTLFVLFGMPLKNNHRAEKLAVLVAAAVVATSDSGSGELGSREFATRAGWPLRRLNPALQFLIHGAIVRPSQNVDRELVAIQIAETRNTRSFLRGNYDPEARRRG